MSTVNQQFELLAVEIENVGKSLDLLRDKISPVLNKETASELVKLEETDVGSSELAKKVASYVSDVKYLNKLVNELSNSVDL